MIETSYLQHHKELAGLADEYISGSEDYHLILRWRVLRNRQIRCQGSSFSMFLQTRSSSKGFQASWAMTRLQIKTRYTCTRGWILLSVSRCSHNSRMPEASIEARVIKIDEVSPSSGITELESNPVRSSLVSACSTWFRLQDSGSDAVSFIVWEFLYPRRSLHFYFIKRSRNASWG